MHVEISCFLLRKKRFVNQQIHVPTAVSDEFVPELTEEFPFGLTRQWYCDKRIVAFSLQSVARQTIDSWFEILKMTMNEWPVDRKWLALHDISGNDQMGFTPYMRARSQELYDYRSDVLQGFIAAVVPKTFVAQLVQLFFRMQRKTHYQNQLFFIRQNALVWLRKQGGF